MNTHVQIQYMSNAPPVPCLRLIVMLLSDVWDGVSFASSPAALCSFSVQINFAWHWIASRTPDYAWAQSVHILRTPCIRLIVIFDFGWYIGLWGGGFGCCPFLLGWCILYISSFFSYTPRCRFWWDARGNARNADWIITMVENITAYTKSGITAINVWWHVRVMSGDVDIMRRRCTAFGCGLRSKQRWRLKI